MNTLNPLVDRYLIDGCMRCKLGATPACKVNKWRTELETLRSIVMQHDLKEELKWGAPCYTYNGKNVILLSALKDAVVISFLKGSLIEDKKNILHKAGENSNVARIVKFKTADEIISVQQELNNFIKAAIDIENKGLKISKKTNDIQIPIELEEIFRADAALKKAFIALTPGKQRGYIIYFTQPKQVETRIKRIEKCREKILNGEGLNDTYKSQSKKKN
jgi:uncharacterized protein YdeI (YjbR/CyaY-like superfamily)